MAKTGSHGIILVTLTCLFVNLTQQQAVKKIIRPGDNSGSGSNQGGGGSNPFGGGGMPLSGNSSGGNLLAAADVEQRLIRRLFNGYSKEGRPVINKNDSVEVKFDLAYSQLKELDSRNQILQSKVWLRQYWVNPFLRWDPEEFGGLKTINVSPDLIWKPDIVLYNNVGFGETGAVYGFDTKAVVRYDGYTEWFAPTEIHSICGIDITYFPFDEQRCLLKFGSWTYTGASLDFVNMRDAADVSQYIESGEWELKEASLVRNVVHYSCCPDPYVDITYTIHIKRKILYYLTNLILPCLLLSALTIFTHCLPPESGERMGLVITILLGLTVFMLLFTDAVPRTSEVIPLIGKYAFTVLCEVAVSLLFTSYVLMIYHKSPRKRMPGWFRNVIYNVLAPLLCKTTPNGDNERNKKSSQCCSFSVSGKSLDESQPPNTLIPNKENGNLYGNRTSSHLQETGFKVDYVNRNGTSEDGLRGPGAILHDASADQKLTEIAIGMQRIIEHLDGVQESDNNKEEWKFAAEVLDSFFFWLLTVTISLSTFIFCLMVP